MSDPCLDGRRGFAYTSGSYAEWERGCRDGGIDPGRYDLSHPVVLIVLLGASLVALFAALSIALPALVAALLMMAAVRVWPGGSSLRYGKAFRTSFLAILAFLGITTVIGVGGALLLQSAVSSGFSERLTHEINDLAILATSRLGNTQGPILATDFWSAAVTHSAGQRRLFLSVLLVLVSPGMLVAAVIVFKGVRPAFSGFLGYLKALLTTVVTIPTAWFISNWVVLVLAERAQVPQLGTTLFTTAAIVAGLSVLGYAVIGGLLAAVVLYGLTRAMAGRGSVSFGRSYGTAVLGLLAYGAATVVAVYLFRDGDDLLRWMSEVVIAGDYLKFATTSMGALADALRRFFPLQIPGLLICGGIITCLIGGPYDGVVGFAKAGIVGGAVSLAILLPFLGLAMFGVGMLSL